MIGGSDLQESDLGVFDFTPLPLVHLMGEQVNLQVDGLPV
jgi:hypothetical protein